MHARRQLRPFLAFVVIPCVVCAPVLLLSCRESSKPTIEADPSADMSQVNLSEDISEVKVPIPPVENVRQASRAIPLADADDLELDVRDQPPLSNINESLVASAGIRKLAGNHVTFYTDLPPGAEVDALPIIFDQAVLHWCRYFKVALDKIRTWHNIGYVIIDKQRFRSTGLLPDNLPPFLNGYQRNKEFWVYEQKSAYYRQHLVLHEGTHAFMNHFLGSAGPPWYMEGVAELLGTHLWTDGQLTLGYFPSSREQVPFWGRVKIIRKDVERNRAKTLAAVMDLNPQMYLAVNPYGWSWAAAAFLDGHPQYRDRFRKMTAEVTQSDFSKTLQELYKADWLQLCEEWQLFVLHMEYGYDLLRETVTFRDGKPIEGEHADTMIAADRGWQSSHVLLEAGTTYTVRASGRYQIADQPKIWWCEPSGVTIRYYRGRPLGILLGALRCKPSVGAVTPLAKPISIGLEHKITPKQTGTLFLRINDSPAELADNAGSCVVRIFREEKEDS